MAGKRNREAGHNYERYCAKCCIEAGFTHVVTTRSESRSRDNQKIDLMNKDEHKNGMLPFSFQCKSYSKKSIDYVSLLNEIETDQMKVVLHRYTVKKGTRFYKEGEYAIMHQADFFKLLKQLNDNK